VETTRFAVRLAVLMLAGLALSVSTDAQTKGLGNGSRAGGGEIVHPFTAIASGQAIVPSDSLGISLLGEYGFNYVTGVSKFAGQEESWGESAPVPAPPGRGERCEPHNTAESSS